MKAFFIKEIGSVGFIENRHAFPNPITQLCKVALLSSVHHIEHTTHGHEAVQVLITF